MNKLFLGYANQRFNYLSENWNLVLSINIDAVNGLHFEFICFYLVPGFFAFQ